MSDEAKVPSKEWLLKMAEVDDSGCTSVGGLACELGLYVAKEPAVSDEAKVDYAYELRRLADSMEDAASDEINELLYDASYFIEHQAESLEAAEADNARLRAEVERWKPRAMTLQEAAKVMRDHAFDGVSDWAVTKDVEAGRMVYSGWRSFHSEKHAVYIAQGLLRDAAASAGEGEDARGGRR